VTILQTGQLSNMGSIPIRVKRFSFLQSVWTGSGTHAASYQTCVFQSHCVLIDLRLMNGGMRGTPTWAAVLGVRHLETFCEGFWINCREAHWLQTGNIGCNKNVDWPLYAEAECTYYGPLRKYHVWEIWTARWIVVPRTFSMPRCD
jgi:hypothetical protein